MIASRVTASGKIRGATEGLGLEFAFSVFFGVCVEYEMCSFCWGTYDVHFVPFHKVCSQNCRNLGSDCDVKGHGKYENQRGTDQQGRDTLSPHNDNSLNGRLCVSVVVPRRGHCFIARKAQFPDLTFWR
jgi:hypothetical protein